MLIEFSVTNYRSIREKQTFSMVAAPRLHKKNCTFSPKVVGEKLPNLLKVAAIYGPNASGKSNLLNALQVVQRLTRMHPTSESRSIPVSPFRFDPALIDKPSKFDYHFVVDGLRYQFELNLTSARICKEKLTAFSNGREELLYDREHHEGGDVYSFGDGLEGGGAIHKVWQRLTGPQMLFISQAVANSSEELVQLRKPYHWLSSGIAGIGDDMNGWRQSVQVVCESMPHLAETLATFMQDIDVPISKIVFESSGRENTKLSSIKPTLDGVAEHLEKVFGGDIKQKTTLTHETALGSANFDIKEESRGTRNLMAFFLPWSILKGNIVAVDELDSSLHPKIVADLVRRHIEENESGQLIFTTHDTHLMDTKLLRRDQFWLTERDKNGATQVRSVHDFAGREGEDIEKRYYEGRYRSLPVLRTS